MRRILKTELNVFLLEFHRHAREVFAKPISFLIGNLVMAGIFIGLRNTPLFAAFSVDNSLRNGLWTYLCWMLCVSAALQPTTDLCFDIGSGVFAKVVQSPLGLVRILRARFYVAILSALFAITIVALALFALGHKLSSLSLLFTFVFLILMFQTYSLMLLSSAVALCTKSLNAALLISTGVIFSLTLLPFGKVFGSAVHYFPIAGPISTIASGKVDLGGLGSMAISSIIFIAVSYKLLSYVILKQKISGRLLML